MKIDKSQIKSKVINFLILTFIAFPVHSDVKRVVVNESNCNKIIGSNQGFNEEVANYLIVPWRSIDVIGARWNGWSCRVILSSPKGNFECVTSTILSNGTSLFAGIDGIGSGSNQSCIKVKN